ncbi:steroid 17-alpha-hydroxylase/17,20 lyase-like [Saccoglossus kowalevskii]|uniref:Steroid 17-alpha-hydroxylase/17,20 lyase-like n=1 Tax=Saccoglossus kowalevskii TaxID=10224 RepID=A0ABM0MW06_SACKO|nr:PREDICTED: steroid 17-alpha-hydroxylase/17,20 lyase-like [Saccoglossus kowalevskii]
MAEEELCFGVEEGVNVDECEGSYERMGRPVYSVKLFDKEVVVISSHKIMLETLAKKNSGIDVAGRPNDFITWDIATYGYKDIGFADYTHKLKTHRRIATKSLKVIGEQEWTTIISNEITQLLDRFKQKDDKAFDPHADLVMVSFNTLCKLIISKTYQFDDPEFQRFLEWNETMFTEIAGNPADFARWLSPLVYSRLTNLRRISELRYQFMKKKLTYIIQSFDKSKKIRNMIDQIILERERLENKANPDMTAEDVYSEDHIIQLTMDLVCVGSETVVALIKWFMIQVMHNPDIQTKIHSELDKVVGRDGMVMYNDREKMPYLDAAIWETLRYPSITPLSVPHRAIRNTSIAGYDIPMDTLVMVNDYAIGCDPDVFDEPFKFKPERFIDCESGCLIPYSKMNFAPFGKGPRSCLGEKLAQIESFVVIGNIMNQFEVHIPEGSAKPPLIGVLGLSHNPEHFRVTLKARKS